MKTFRSIGVSHRLADASVRDRVTFSAAAAADFLDALAADGVAQAMVLATCNRCEVFFWGDDAAADRCHEAFVGRFAGVRLDGVLEVRAGRDALVYLCRVAAGLESMVLGEYQILGQVKEAHAAALASGHVGKELDRILRDAVSCAKRVKTELDIGAVPPSVCRAGMAHIEALAGLDGKRVLVIGSGKTGTLAVRFAREHGAARIAVCNRSPERAKKLEERFGAVVVDYAQRYAVIADSDVVVSATASPHVVVRAEQVALTHPVVFLDLASPRDVDPALAKNPMATLVSIDTIGELARGDREERDRLTAAGMTIVTSAVDDIEAWLEAVRTGRTGER